MRFFVTEFLREAVLEQLDEEAPGNGIAVEIEGSIGKEPPPCTFERCSMWSATIRSGSLIGAGGSRIKELGKAARAKIEPWSEARSTWTCG